ncbi:MAG: hypothetical protein FWD38_11655 [Oscillospiraceae bacterium]|nr:hypothetical protein [Oscillospiraceae bacterium]
MLNEVNSITDETSDDVEDIFQLGLKAWEGFEANTNFTKAKQYIGEAKRRGHELAGMYWDIICAFEDAAKEGE